VAYHFNPQTVIDLCTRYLRDGQEEESGNFYEDTPPDDVSTCTRGDNYKNVNELNGTQTISGTCPHLCHEGKEAQEAELEHDGTCTTKPACTIQLFEKTKESDGGTRGHEDSGGIAEKNCKKELSNETPGQVRCRDCGKAEVGNGYAFCQGTPWNGIPGQVPDKLHQCQDFTPINEIYREQLLTN